MDNLIQKVQPMLFEKIRLLTNFYPDYQPELDGLASIVQNDFTRMPDHSSKKKCLDTISKMKEDYRRIIEEVWEKSLSEDIFLTENINLIAKEGKNIFLMAKGYFNSL